MIKPVLIYFIKKSPKSFFIAFFLPCMAMACNQENYSIFVTNEIVRHKDWNNLVQNTEAMKRLFDTKSDACENLKAKESFHLKTMENDKLYKEVIELIEKGKKLVDGISKETNLVISIYKNKNSCIVSPTTPIQNVLEKYELTYHQNHSLLNNGKLKVCVGSTEPDEIWQ